MSEILPEPFKLTPKACVVRRKARPTFPQASTVKLVLSRTMVSPISSYVKGQYDRRRPGNYGPTRCSAPQCLILLGITTL